MVATMLTQLTGVLGASADGRWMGCDYVLALFAGTFPAWSLFTLMREWVCPNAIRVRSRK